MIGGMEKLRDSDVAVGAAGALGLVAVWEVAARTGLVDPQLFPSPLLAIGMAAERLTVEAVGENLAWSLFRVFSGFGLGAVAGAVSAAAVRQVWKRIGGTDQVPDARDPSRDWAEVLLAAALQGAIFALVRAAVDRAAAASVGRAVGEWPVSDKPTRIKLPI